MKKHGHAVRGARSREYVCWINMRVRCQDETHHQYPSYGARGISVCDRWQQFENFLADMSPMPGPGFTIERTDNDKGYEPTNCKWGTRLEQARNMRPRKNNPSGAVGVYRAKSCDKWLASITIGGGKRKYLGVFDRLEDAIAARRDAEKLYWSVAA